jgi:hypothetical protein
MMAAVFAMQPLGQLSASSIGIFTLLGIGRQEFDYSTAAVAVDTIRRLIAGIGGVYVLPAILFHFLIPESPRFTLSKGDSEKVSRDVAHFYQRKDSSDDIELESVSANVDNFTASGYHTSIMENGIYLERLSLELEDRVPEEVTSLSQITPRRTVQLFQHIDNNGNQKVVDSNVESNANDHEKPSFSFRAMLSYLKGGDWQYLGGTTA